jgi:hypothetical protein
MSLKENPMSLSDILLEIGMFSNSLHSYQEEIPGQAVRRRMESNLQHVAGLLPSAESRPGMDVLEKLKMPVDSFLKTGIPGVLAEQKNLRRLCYFFDSPALVNPPLLNRDTSKKLLDLMFRAWRNAFISPLFSIILRNFKKEQRKSLCYRAIKELIVRKLPAYQGRKQFLNFAKQNLLDFLEDSGPVRIAMKIEGKGTDYFSACNALGIPEYILRTHYFGFVLIEYIEATNSADGLIEDESIKKIGNLAEADAQKVAIAAIILKFQNQEELVPRLTSLAFLKVGDPMIPSLWILNSMDFFVYQELVNNARGKAISWINRQIIDYFFEKAEMDAGRKEFWRKYASKFSMIRVAMFYGYGKIPKLSQNPDLDSWLKSRIIRVVSDTKGDIALIMEYEQWVIVEIGTHGNACYLYNKNNPKVSDLSNSIKNLARLKTPMLGILHEFDPPMQGRMVHHDGWQLKFRYILSNGIGLKR